MQSLRDKGVKFETKLPGDAPAMLIVCQGKNGPEYRVGFNNFYVITRYNRSTMYAHGGARPRRGDPELHAGRER